MFRRIQALFRVAHEARCMRQFDAGEQWAHDEIVFGHGYKYVERRALRDRSSFGQGARHALEIHAWIRDVAQRERMFARLEQQMLGR